MHHQSFMFKCFLALFSLIFTTSTVYAVDALTNLNQPSISKTELIKKLAQNRKERIKLGEEKFPMNGVSSKIKSEKRTDNGGWGGGTIVLRGQKSPILYDLYIADPHYQETFNIIQNLPETDFLKSMGYEYFKVQQLAEYPLLIARLEQWRPKAAGLVSLILQSLKSLEISYTTIPLIRIDGLVETRPLEQGHTLEPVILFNRAMNLRLYLPYWQRMGDQSRIAALIHEAFRNIQIIADFNNEESDLDLKIEKITQFLMMHDPSEVKDYLDYTQFFDGALILYLLSEEDKNLNLIEYATVYRPEYLMDPKIKQRLSNPERNEQFIKSRSANAALEERIKLFKLSDRYPFIAEAIEKTETFIRDYLKYPREFSPKARFQAETFMKGLRLQNIYMQERWIGESAVTLAFDIKKLMFLQLEFPQVDIFGEIQKYGCLTPTRWLTPVEKMQTRESNKMLALQEKEEALRLQCMQKIFENHPELMLEYLKIISK